MKIWSYDNHSEGMKLLSTKLNENGIATEIMSHSRPAPFGANDKKVVLNWGFQRGCPIPGAVILNKPENISNASNKKKCLGLLVAAGVSTPEFTQDKTTAKRYFTAQSNCKVYCRTTANGAYGDGIIIATSSNTVVDAELYTKGIKCKREYRTYMFNGKMIDLVASIRTSTLPEGVTAYNDDIRNWKGGYGWVRNAVTIPDAIKTKLEEISKKAMLAVGLDFGAIDIVRDFDDNLYVLEINTAPGWENYTAKKYADVIKEYYDNLVAPAPRARNAREAIMAPVARTTERPSGLDDEEWNIILARRTEIARNARNVLLSNLRADFLTKMSENNITREEWSLITRRHNDA